MGRADDLFSRLEARGESAVDELIADRVSEELFMDFKCSADRGQGSKLHKTDLENLADAISGFGNSEGGIVIWGVDCRRLDDGSDVASAKTPIHEIRRFVSWLEGAISGRTIPPHSSGVRSIVLPIAGAKSGFAATLIPKCPNAPLQSNADGHYYVRAGSSFVRMQHSVLAGMFGRRPEANVYRHYTCHPAIIDENGDITAEMGLLLRNDGPGIATDIYCNLSIESSPRAPNAVSFGKQSESIWITSFLFGSHLNMIARPEIRLAPEASVVGTVVTVSIKAAVTEPLRISGSVGSSTSAPHRFVIESNADLINEAQQKFRAIARRGKPSKSQRAECARDIFGFRDPE